MLEPHELEALIDRLRGKIDDDTWEFMDDYFRHGEYGLSIEVLCDRVEDLEGSFPDEEVDVVKKIGDDMGIDRESFKALVKRVDKAIG